MKSPLGGAVVSYHVEVWHDRNSGHENTQTVF